MKSNGKKPSENIDALIFIDTNIFLDFYRLSNNLQLDFLKLIEDNKEKIIMSSQVFMEFKKNRQTTIIKTLEEFIKNGNLNISFPSIIRDESFYEVKELIEKLKSKYKENVKRFNDIYKDPENMDEVYKVVNSLSKEKDLILLTHEHQDYKQIFDLAYQRFICGFPPRKNDDTSIGDAINWEWLIYCSKKFNKDVIIVSRDGDFGKKLGSEIYINDFLRDEFKEKTEKIVLLTSELTTAFSILDVEISNEMITEEANLLAEYRPFSILNSPSILDDLQQSLDNSMWVGDKSFLFKDVIKKTY